MNKVLILSYYFPPAGGSAVQRVLKFVKYLPKYGWQPVVLTAREKDYVLRDDSLLAEVPETVKIVRTPAPDLYSRYNKMTKSGESQAADLSALSPGGSGEHGIHKLALAIRSAFFIPDARIGWLPFAVGKAIQIIRREKIKVVFATSPPFTTALAGGLVGSIMKIPWISDYRDPWTQAYFYFPRPPISQNFETFLERICLRKADRIVSINQRILNNLEAKYGKQPGSKKIVLPNGFDPEDFNDLKPLRESCFTITYTGTQNGRMHAGQFLKAIKQLGEKHPDFKKNIRLNFIGRIGPDVMHRFNDIGYSGNLHFIDHLPHRECLRYTSGADLLLLLLPEIGGDVVMTGKLFEYLRSGNPVLCLAEHGEAAEIIRRANAGFTVPNNDVDAIQKTIWSCYLKWKKGRRLLSKPPRKEVVDTYNREEVTKKLAGLFQQTASIPAIQKNRSASP